MFKQHAAMMLMKRVCGLLIVGTALLSACNRSQPEGSSGVDKAAAQISERLFSVESVIRGAKLYQERCAQCHGPEAQGHPDWLTAGVVAAPPLNGTGNDWKRNKDEFVKIIKDGAKRDGKLVMPVWAGRLNEQDIEDVITWFQALWPSDVYERWRKVNANPEKSKAKG
jgi:mono/diheme cytochrome c family protein